jgi:hypothetical protein
MGELGPSGLKPNGTHVAAGEWYSEPEGELLRNGRDLRFGFWEKDAPDVCRHSTS